MLLNLFSPYPIMDKFERARIIGARAFELALNAEPKVKPDDIDPVKVAIKEFEAGKTPLKVKEKRR
jgi:DNA-directed RNA polymerase subunit K/omega